MHMSHLTGCGCVWCIRSSGCNVYARRGLLLRRERLPLHGCGGASRPLRRLCCQLRLQLRDAPTFVLQRLQHKK